MRNIYCIAICVTLFSIALLFVIAIAVARSAGTNVKNVDDYIDYGKSEPITSLMRAALEGDRERVIDLLELGASVEKVGGGGYTAMEFAIMDGHYDVAILLLDAGSDPNHMPANQFCSLVAVMQFEGALEDEKLEFFIDFLDYGASPIILAETPLFFAIENNLPNYLTALFDALEAEDIEGLCDHLRARAARLSISISPEVRSILDSYSR